MHIPITYFDDQWHPDPAGLNFRGSMPVENGADSGVIGSCYLRWSAMWGNSWAAGNFRGAALTADGRGVGDTGWRGINAGVDTAGNLLDYWTIPDADAAGHPARVVYVEGRREHAAVTVTALILPLAK